MLKFSDETVMSQRAHTEHLLLQHLERTLRRSLISLSISFSVIEQKFWKFTTDFQTDVMVTRLIITYGLHYSHVPEVSLCFLSPHYERSVCEADKQAAASGKGWLQPLRDIRIRERKCVKPNMWAPGFCRTCLPAAGRRPGVSPVLYHPSELRPARVAYAQSDDNAADWNDFYCWPKHLHWENRVCNERVRCFNLSWTCLNFYKWSVVNPLKETDVFTHT